METDNSLGLQFSRLLSRQKLWVYGGVVSVLQAALLPHPLQEVRVDSQTAAPMT